MSKSENLLFCYNKGCGKKFDPTENTDTACQFHPGLPIFHDARKKWSCCNNGSTDFSVFLSLPGCAKGSHNPEKPPDEAPPKREPAAKTDGDDAIIIRGPVPPPPTPKKRPSADEEMLQLEPSVAASLRSALETRMKQLELASASDTGNADDASSQEVQKGTLCKNAGCKGVYQNPGSNDEVCYFHTGVPIFHEGYKFWSCCQRRTSDFDDFLSQVGCNEGKHKWISAKPAVAPSRWDWHQTGTFITITLYAKCIIPESVEVKINQVRCSIDCMFDAGLAAFQRSYNLEGVIDPKNSNVKLMGTKMEINLRKAEPCTWAKLELPS